MKSVLLFISLFISVFASSQNINIKTSIYFDVDSFKLVPEHYKRLEKLADTLSWLSIQGIMVNGNTDADADSMYNIRLSLKRGASVKEFLRTKGFDTSKIKLDYYGENKPISNNQTEQGKQKNRRVDIIARCTLPQKPGFILTDTLYEILPDTCEGDTTFILPQGTIVTMDKCEFLQQQECDFAISEFILPETVRDSGLNTMDVNGSVLMSGGMFNIKTCGNFCLKKPIIIRILIKEGCEPLCTMGMWEQSGAGWRAEGTTVKIVNIGSRRYYEFEMLCPGFKNLDCGYNMQMATVKLPRRYKLLELKIMNDCPLWSYERGASATDNIRKQKICIICQETKDLKENSVYIKALTPNGDTAILNYKKIKDLRLKYKLFPGHSCRGPKQKKPCPNILYYFGRRKSKIEIREKDFDIIIPGRKTNTR